MGMSKTQDLFQNLTDKIVAMIEQGQAGNWQKPWKALAGSGLHSNAKTKKAYQGFNQLMLMVVAAEQGYSQAVWATYKQWQELGGQVRRGERGVKLVKWGRTYVCECGHKDQAPCQGEGHEQEAKVWASYFVVFNIAQQDGYKLPQAPIKNEVERQDEVERFVAATGANIQHVPGDAAFYRPSTDTITMPLVEQSDNAQGYYGTLLHELIHWTSAPQRLGRETGKRFGDNEYGAEELVAELGATFLAAHFQVETEPHIEHVSYLNSWLKTLKADPMALYKAAKLAQEATTYLLELAGMENEVSKAA